MGFRGIKRRKDSVKRSLCGSSLSCAVQVYAPEFDKVLRRSEPWTAKTRKSFMAGNRYFEFKSKQGKAPPRRLLRLLRLGICEFLIVTKLRKEGRLAQRRRDSR